MTFELSVLKPDASYIITCTMASISTKCEVSTTSQFGFMGTNGMDGQTDGQH